MPDTPPKVELLQFEEGPDFRVCYAKSVKNLIPFQNSQSWKASGLFVKAGAQKVGLDWHLTFQVQDPGQRLLLPPAFQASAAAVPPRQEGLWKATCFEMFLQPEGGLGYYEFNFSLTPAWDLYHFQNYRQPQPPKRSDDFRLRSLLWDGRNLRIEIFSLHHFAKCRVGLTTVLKESSGEVHYLALAHKGPKADFHLADGFVLNL